MTQDTTTTNGLSDLFKLVSDYAKEAASTYKDVYQAFNPDKTQAATTTQKAATTSYTAAWLTGSGIILIALVIIILIARK